MTTIINDFDASEPIDNHKNPIVGRVRKYHSNYYYVDTAFGLLECFLKGLLKKQGTHILVGDNVLVDNVTSSRVTGSVASGRIIECLERQNQLSRPKMSNVDLAIVVQSFTSPRFDATQVDRYLTHIALTGVQPVLCLTKVDLHSEFSDNWSLDEIKHVYQTSLGIPVFETSILDIDSYTSLKQAIQNKVSVLVGQSGVGKSSLLNVLNPSLDLRVGALSEKLQRGQQTTRHVELVPIPAAGNDTSTTFIADTPGFSHLAFDHVLPEDLQKAFPELVTWQEQCEFSDCLHLHEEGCKIRQNIDAMTLSRYESYAVMMSEAQSYAQAAQQTSQKDEGAVKSVHTKGKRQLVTKLDGKHRQPSRRVDKQRASTARNTSVDTTTDFLEDEL